MLGEDTMVQATETEVLRQQLLQAQRLSSMGTLASSVAHEFNNILTTIINYAKIGLRAQGNDKSRIAIPGSVRRSQANSADPG